MSRDPTFSTPVIVEVVRGFGVSAETVFDAWLTPALAREFLFADSGSMVRCDIEPHVGGGFTVIERRPRDDNQPGSHKVEHVGRYLEIERLLRLVFGFSVPQYSSEETIVTLDLRDLEAGASELALTHARRLGRDAAAPRRTGRQTRLSARVARVASFIMAAILRNPHETTVASALPGPARRLRPHPRELDRQADRRAGTQGRPRRGPGRGRSRMPEARAARATLDAQRERPVRLRLRALTSLPRLPV